MNNGSPSWDTRDGNPTSLRDCEACGNWPANRRVEHLHLCGVCADYAVAIEEAGGDAWDILGGDDDE